MISEAHQVGASFSISLRGFVQTRTDINCEFATIQPWIPAASWNPVPCGLESGHSEFNPEVM
jgi:hypothetical protein